MHWRDPHGPSCKMSLASGEGLSLSGRATNVSALRHFDPVGTGHSVWVPNSYVIVWLISFMYMCLYRPWHGIRIEKQRKQEQEQELTQA